MDIEIRPYQLSDKFIVLSLFKLNTPTYFSPDEESDFIKYLDYEKALYFVVCFNQKPIGCGGLNLFYLPEIQARISWDIVHPDFQGQSIGSTLLKYRIALLQSEYNCTNITVRTSQHVFQFYEKHGFTTNQIVPDYWAKGFDLYEMYLHL